MPQIMQRPLSGVLRDCALDGDQIRPCGYHMHRAHSTPFGITGDVLEVVEGQQTALLRPHPDLKELAGLLRDGADPAGGWYLVKEQRTWLEERLFEFLVSRRGYDTVRILEAGVASYVHHYTYVAILAAVMSRLPDPPRIALTVVDKCPYPILQIREVERELAAGMRRSRSISVAGQKLHISRRFFDVLTPKVRDFGRSSVELWVKNLEFNEQMSRLGRFDLITEHFLTAVLDQQLEQITRIRHVYSRLLEPGGYLFCATGITERSPSYHGYTALHPNLGLECIEAKTRVVWDPFGLAREELLQFSLGRRATPLPCALDNTLAVYRKG